MLTFDICIRILETTYWHARLPRQLENKTSSFPDPNYSKTYSPLFAMSYSGNTVAQLKELLKQRNLSTDGLKADLINRLQDDDSTKNSATNEPSSIAEVEATASATAAAAPTITSSIPEAVPADASAAVPENENVPSTEEDKLEKTPPATPAPKNPELSQDQLKQAAIDHLQKKIYRAEKFGQDDSTIDDLQRQINRIEKFGLDLSTQLAKELGFGKGPDAAVGKPDRKSFQKKNRNKSNNKRR